MKPVKLVLEGVNSFMDAQTLDFEKVGRSDLFCICGKTGAGKTTIFDSIMLALYGRTSRGKLCDCINLSRMSATVDFEFIEGEERYRIVRTIKCKNERGGDGNLTTKRVYAGSECVLYKNGEPVANSSDEVGALVDRIIGLSIGEFKNVYMLEQGEYAEFLKKSTANQAEAVGRIFSLMRFGEVYKLAHERQNDENKGVEATELRIRDVGEASPEMLRAAKTELSGLRAKNTALIKDIEKKREELDILAKARDEYISAAEKEKAVHQQAERLKQAEKRLFAAQAALEEFLSAYEAQPQGLIALREELNRLSELNALDREYTQAALDCERKRAALEQKSQRRQAVENTISELKARVQAARADVDSAISEFSAAADGLKSPSAAVLAARRAFAEDGASAINDIIYSLKAEKDAFDALCAQKAECEAKAEEARARRANIMTLIEKYNGELAALAEACNAAAQAEREAMEAFTRAQIGSHAAAVRSELKPGDMCPVCGGIFGGGNECADSDVESAKRAHMECENALKAVTEQHARVQKLIDKAKDDYERADSDLRSAEENIRLAQQKIADSGVEREVYAMLSAALGKAKKAAESYAAANAELMKSEPAAATAEAEYSAAQVALAESEAKARELSARLGEYCGRTSALLEEVRGELSALEKRIAETEKQKAALTAEAEGARAAVAAIKAGLDEAARACPVDMPAFDEEGYNNKKDMCEALLKQHAEREKDIALKDAEIAALTQKCDKLKLLTAERNERAKRADRYRIIAEMTKGKIMLNYVAAEYIEQFTAIASDILAEMSHGKYTMSYDQTDGFVVTDFLNDGMVRKTDTLSGGEMFLASLAVAIAIARAVGRGKNAFFFLDEGFGTLDDELIDTVYGALESLSKDCLVGVISHAEALIDRMPAKVEVLEATDTAGSRIEY